MKLVILITSEITNGLDVANGWQEAGAPGVTIIRSHGLYALQQEARRGRVELPRMAVSFGRAIASILDNVEEKGEIVMSVCEDDLVDRLVEKTGEFLDLGKANQGILFVMDVERAVGIDYHGRKKGDPE